MKIRIDDACDEATARAIATVVSEHLDRPVECVDEAGETVLETGDTTDWAEEPAVVTEREERIREDIADIMAGGPERGHELIEDLGKVFVRDRLEMVFDEVNYEDGTFARFDADDRLPADGMITGVGSIDGRRAAFAANDYTVKGGSIGQMGSEKENRITERAGGARLPLVRLIDSTGARLSPGERTEGETHADKYTGGRLFYLMSRLSGQVPQIGVLYGPDIAGSAYIPVFCDFLIMVEKISGMAIASPRVVKEVIGEDVSMQELGGPDVHATESGSADLVVPDEEAAAEAVRDLFEYLPQRYDGELPTVEPKPPSLNPHGLDAVIPDEPNKPYDVHEVIDRLVDRDSFFELKARFAPELVTGFAHIDGQPVGILANQPSQVSGALFPDSAEKGAGFIWQCDAFGIPLVYLCDTPGFMAGSQVERDGVLKKGRKMVYATSCAEVPKFCVITRKAYGAGIYAMAGPAFGTDATLALPTSEIAVMGPDAIVRAMYADNINDIKDPDERLAFIEEQKTNYEKDVRKQAARMQVDELIPAGDLREQLVERLRTYEHKPRDDPDRIHGSILF